MGTTRAPFPVQVMLAQGGTVATTAVVTGGATGLDFTLSANSSAGYCSATTYSPGQTCLVDVVFAPRYPGIRMGAVVLRDGNNQVIGTAQVSAVATGALPVLFPGLTSTVAGNENFLYQSPGVSDGIPAVTAPIQLPKGVAIDALGNLYISDYLNYRIRKVTANAAGTLDASSIITTVAGNGNPGFTGDGGPATSASIASPTGLAIDGAGNLYFADTNNDVIRKIDTAGTITTVVGQARSAGYTGDGGSPTMATLDHPEGVAIDLQGNLLIADTHNNVIRIVTLEAASPTISTLQTSQLNLPSQIAVRPDGSLLVSNTGSNQILSVQSGATATVIAGSGVRGYAGDGGAATAAQLNQPVGVAIDPAGNIYIADQGNNRLRVVSSTNQQISTAAGTGSESFAGDCSTDQTPAPNLCGPQTNASFNGPWSVQFSPGGDLYLSDPFHNRIRRFSGSNVLARYATIRNLKISPPQTITVRNVGNAQLSLTAPTCTDTKIDGAPPVCAYPASAPATLAPNDGLSIPVDYTPNVPGPFPYSGTGSMQINVASATPVLSPPVINAQAQVLDVNPTTTTLTSASNPGLVNTPIHFVATVSNNNAGAFSGNVTFTVDNATICSSVALNGVTAACDITFTSLGHHSVVATYSGDAQDADSTSAPVDQVIKLSLDSHSAVVPSPNPQVVTNAVQFTFTAVAPNGSPAPTGTVTFSEGGTDLITVALSSGVATYSTTTLSVGTHTVVASYSGDSTYMPYQSTATETITTASTTTLLSTSATPVYSGQSVTFTAVVNPTITTTLTGTVTFMDGATVLASSVPLNAQNQAAFTTTALSTGSHTIRAVYSGDVNNATSSSVPLSEQVDLIGTSTTLLSSANPLQAGAVLHLSAQVTIAAGMPANGPIAGSVLFRDGTAVLSTVQVDGNGSATLDVSALSVGSHLLTATYSGSAQYAQSSGTLTQTVQQTGTTTVGAAQTPVALAGLPVTLTATVTSTTGTPTGTVTFQDGGTTIGSSPLNAQGRTSYTTSNLPAGTHTITAVYQGDSNYTPSTSNPFSQQINKAAPQLTLSGPASAVNVTTSATYTVGLTTPGATPTGTLTLYDGTNAIGSQPISAAGTFTFATSSLTVGQHSITVSYNGDLNTQSAVSNAALTTVQLAPSTAVLVTSQSPAIVGSSITLTATVTSVTPNVTGSVQIQDGNQILGSVPLANGVAVFNTSTLPFGVHTLSAIYSGDANHATATSTSLRQAVIYQAVLAVTAAPNPAYTGQDVVLAANVAPVNGTVPTGTLTFQDGGVLLGSVHLDASGAAVLHNSTLAVGNHAITILYSGDDNFSSGSAGTSLTVRNSLTQTSLQASANPSTYGAPLTLSAAVTSSGGPATGTVRFLEGTSVVGAATLDGSGNASFQTTTLIPGPHSIVAQYVGDGRAGASTSNPISFLVKQRTTLVISADNNPALTLDRIVLHATLGYNNSFPATGSVTFFEGGTPLGTAQLNASGVATATIAALPTGTHSITASYSGDDSDFAATAATFSQNVTIRSTMTQLSAFASNKDDPQQITYIGIVQSPTLSSVAGPTGTISFYRGTTLVSLAQLDANGVTRITVELQANTSATLTAVYSGDANYASSTSNPSTTNPGPPTQFLLSVSNTNLKLQSSQRQTVTVTVASISGFNDTMNLGCVGLPYAATCTFDKPSMKLAADGSASMNLVIDTGDPLGAGAQAAVHSPELFSRSKAALCGLPLAAMLLCGFRRRSVHKLLLLTLAAAITLGAVGCGGLKINSTPAGSYSFQVTAIGQGTRAQEAVTVTLAVTQ
ncbi:Ig-like domain repeat protein [Terriglobus aquaticus]|uniref:Ig-like domain repeat protein n=1 Tax=Terriglobus aquaticus TaxID=940139 RepID=A0ABW9KJJ3_9BACT|nr:Ig-like domain repeat protein [Terriglobus aquaticus]